MSRTTLKAVVVLLVSAFLISMGEGNVSAATLNPEGVNPHKDAPRKRITQEQKQNAAEARKNRMPAGRKKVKKAKKPGALSSPEQMNNQGNPK